jgi:lipoprotein NlpD
MLQLTPFRLLLAVLVLHGCTSRVPAPVVDRSPPPPAPPVTAPPAPAPTPAAAPTPVEKPLGRGPVHIVARGETLIGIALARGLDYRELAAWNNITNVNRLEVGQELRLTAPGAAPRTGTVTSGIAGAAPVEVRPLGSSPPPSPNTAREKVEPKTLKLPYSERALAQLSAPEAGAPVAPSVPVPVPPQEAPAVAPVTPGAAPAAAAPSDGKAEADAVDWAWPAKGRIVGAFSKLTKGIEIAGKKGDPILAAGAGRVMYVGSGVRGYGKLVIVKHNDTFISAYAHNDSILVKEGQEVKKGQRIAEMGSSDSDRVKLGFQVRRKGEPVDPTGYLPK